MANMELCPAGQWLRGVRVVGDDLLMQPTREIPEARGQGYPRSAAGVLWLMVRGLHTMLREVNVGSAQALRQGFSRAMEENTDANLVGMENR